MLRHPPPWLSVEPLIFGGHSKEGEFGYNHPSFFFDTKSTMFPLIKGHRGFCTINHRWTTIWHAGNAFGTFLKIIYDNPVWSTSGVVTQPYFPADHTQSAYAPPPYDH